VTTIPNIANELLFSFTLFHLEVEQLEMKTELEERASEYDRQIKELTQKLTDAVTKIEQMELENKHLLTVSLRLIVLLVTKILTFHFVYYAESFAAFHSKRVVHILNVYNYT